MDIKRKHNMSWETLFWQVATLISYLLDRITLEV